METKTKSTSGVDFTVNCSSNHDTKKFVGSLETKYKWSDYGKLQILYMVHTDHAKSWNLKFEFSRPQKSWEINQTVATF